MLERSTVSKMQSAMDTLPIHEIDLSRLPVYTAKQVAKIFHVHLSRVYGWHRNGLLQAHYQVLSGQSLRLLFAHCDVVKFWEDHFPRPEDLTAPNADHRSPNVEQVRRLLAMRRMCGGRSPKKKSKDISQDKPKKP